MELADKFKIYVDRLRNGKREKLEESVPSDFLVVEGDEISFDETVELDGEAYLAEDHLVLHIDATVACQLPCSMCNEPVKAEIMVRGFYHVEPAEKIKSGVFDYSDSLREALLLEAPRFIQCNGGSCKSRKELSPYLRDQKKESGMESHPFSELTAEAKEDENGSTT